MLLLVPGEGLFRCEFGAALVAVVCDLVRRPRVTVQGLLVRALHVALGALQGRCSLRHKMDETRLRELSLASICYGDHPTYS